MLRTLTQRQKEELTPAEQRRAQLGGIVDVGMLTDSEVMKLWQQHASRDMQPKLVTPAEQREQHGRV